MATAKSTLMVQGTASDAGKSTIVAGIGRLLVRRGVHVAPFKPQNMALNSAVTKDGGEIGRAQAVQAVACRVDAAVDMNPILLKPHSDTGAQVIVHGQVMGNMNAVSYHQYKQTAMKAVMESYGRLIDQYDCVLVEGAGSPAEINLRDRDIANMGFAEEADCDVVLVADIDKGGVFAQLVGTMTLLSEAERKRVKGFIINRFRGDISLLASGLEWLTNRTGVPVLGVVPYIAGFHLEAEDAINQDQVVGNNAVKICVPVIPRISNHTDFDPLRLHPEVDLTYVAPGSRIPACDLIILPGSKAVRQDFQYLQEQGWSDDIYRHLRYKGKLLGICGGYQMLGSQIHDPSGIEGSTGSSNTLGLLDCETTLTPKKSLLNVSGTLLENGATITGYEIHAGRTIGSALSNPWLEIKTEKSTTKNFATTPEGARSEDNQIRGTYLHGLFESTDVTNTLLKWAGMKNEASDYDYAAFREQEIDRLADTLENSLDLSTLLPLCGLE